MHLKHTDNGSVSVRVESPYGSLSGQYARNHNGPIFDADGNQLGTMKFEIRTPEPGQATKKTKAPPEQLDLKKPGDFLAYLIKKVTNHSEQDSRNADDINCNCRKIRTEMNEKGWLWCLRNRDDLLKRVAESAKKKGFNVEPDNIWTAFTSAWSETRKDSA